MERKSPCLATYQEAKSQLFTSLAYNRQKINLYYDWLVLIDDTIIHYIFSSLYHPRSQGLTANSIGNSMVSSAIWKKTCSSEFFKHDQNCTRPKDEYNLKSLKNSRVVCFSNCTRNHTIKY